MGVCKLYQRYSAIANEVYKSDVTHEEAPCMDLMRTWMIDAKARILYFVCVQS